MVVGDAHPVGSPLRRQALTGCPVESQTFPDHTFLGGVERARRGATARGITSHDGASAWPHPNHTKAKNPSTATVTPRLRPAGNALSTGPSWQARPPAI
jgi:hypothetical protein